MLWTFRTWDLVGGLEVTGVMPVNEIVRALSPLLSLAFLVHDVSVCSTTCSHHEVQDHLVLE